MQNCQILIGNAAAIQHFCTEHYSRDLNELRDNYSLDLCESKDNCNWDLYELRENIPGTGMSLGKLFPGLV